MTFGVGVAGILASGLINYNIERLSASVFNLILGAFLIVVTVLVKEET
jgi:drug/metabolite transporter (DMT)-like permease